MKRYGNTYLPTAPWLFYEQCRMRRLTLSHRSGKVAVRRERERIQTRWRKDLVLLCLQIRMEPFNELVAIFNTAQHGWANRRCLASPPLA